MLDAPYIDYEKPWWWSEFIANSSIGSDAVYLLAGDISLTSITCMSAMYFNKRLYESCVGGSYEDLYRLVADGKWTYDVLSGYAKTAYQDLNGDGKRGTEDRYGFVARTDTEPEHFTFSAGFRYSERDSEGYPVLCLNNQAYASYTELLDQLYYENEGALIVKGEQALYTPFLEGRALFLVNLMMAYRSLRDMEDEHGIIPYPKLDEEQEKYLSLLHDTTSLYSVPTTVADADMDAVCAVLEAMSYENYVNVMPAFYETALKVKYQSDSIAADMIDLIRAGATTDIVYVYSYALNNIGTLSRTLISSRQNFASLWTQQQSAAEARLQDLIQLYKDAKKQS